MSTPLPFIRTASSRQRIVHLYQYTGKPLIDISFADFDPLGKSLEWGINVHMGQEFSLANQMVMMAVSTEIIVMSVSAAVMWWKRRPRGSLGVPPLPKIVPCCGAWSPSWLVVESFFRWWGRLLMMLLLDWLFTRRPRLPVRACRTRLRCCPAPEPH